MIPAKKYVRILFWVSFTVFILNKFLVRTWVVKNDAPEVLGILTYSLPNLLEAIMGCIVVTGLLFQVQRYFKLNIKDILVYLVSTFLAGIYVITQELKYHNLGGNNIYDPNDLIASILGLVGMFVVFSFFGFQAASQSNH